MCWQGDSRRWLGQGKKAGQKVVPLVVYPACRRDGRHVCNGSSGQEGAAKL